MLRTSGFVADSGFVDDVLSSIALYRPKRRQKKHCQNTSMMAVYALLALQKLKHFCVQNQYNKYRSCFIMWKAYNCAAVQYKTETLANAN